MSTDALIARFDVTDPEFIADPYPTLNALREATPIFWNERTNQWMITAATEYIDYTRALIAEKRRNPDGLLVSELVRVEDEGDALTEDEIVSTTMVLLEAGHEATVNKLGNGVRALMLHPSQWRRLVSDEVSPRASRSRSWCAGIHRCSCSSDGSSNLVSRSPANRWRQARRWRCCSELPSAILGASTIRPLRHRPRRHRPHRIRRRHSLLCRCAAGAG